MKNESSRERRDTKNKQMAPADWPRERDLGEATADTLAKQKGWLVATRRKSVTSPDWSGHEHLWANTLVHHGEESVVSSVGKASNSGRSVGQS